MFDSHGFPTTCWSYISLLREAEGESRNELLGPFLQRYRPALSDFLRLKMAIRCQHDREDYIQGFLADRIIAKGILQQARAERGKLRSFVLSCLVNYVKDQQKSRAFRQMSVAESWEGQMTPKAWGSVHAQIFDALWAREVTSQALQRFRDECFEKKRPHVWKIFSKRVLEPIESSKQGPAYSELAEEMRLKVTQVKNYMVTAKRAYQRHLRDVIDEYTLDDEETSMEIKLLRQALANGIQ